MSPELISNFLMALSTAQGSSRADGSRSATVAREWDQSDNQSASTDPEFDAIVLVPTVSFSDEACLESVRAGDKEALSILFRRYARLVRAIAYRILRNASEADDLLQEVFLYIFRKTDLFDGTKGSARSWIVQTVAS